MQTQNRLHTPLHRPGIKVAWLSCFVELARLGELSAAAQTLGISPPALRRNLEQLETYLQIQLIQFKGADFKLTAAGEELRVQSQGVLRDLKILMGLECDPLPHNTPTLKLGLAAHWLSKLLIPFSAQMNQLFSQYSLSIAIEPEHQTREEKLHLGELDLVLSFEPPTDPQLNWRAGPNSPYCSVSSDPNLRPRHEWRYALPDKDLGLAWPALAPEQVLLKSCDLQVLIEMALRGVCVVYLPQSLLQPYLDQQRLFILDKAFQAPVFTPYFVWLSTHPLAQSLNSLACFESQTPSENQPKLTHR